MRRIPTLSFEARSVTSKLVQVQALVRHGARAPASKYNCWSNYSPQWNCIVDEVVQGRIPRTLPEVKVSSTATSPGVELVNDRPYFPNQDASSTTYNFFGPGGWLGRVFPTQEENKVADSYAEVSQTAYYEKLYDADPNANVLGGTCLKGQLLAEGLQQHQLIGHLLAEAYQAPNGDSRVPFASALPLIDSARYDDEIRFRASDMQRTQLSGSALLTSFLKSINENPSQMRPISIHTMDLEREYIFPNLGICPGLRRVRENIFASRGYAALREKYLVLEQKIKLAVGREDISDVWPGEFFDCIMTTICTDQVNQLPSGLRPEVILHHTDSDGKLREVSLLNYTFAAVDDYATYEYTWQDAIFSRTAMARFYVELKAEILRAVYMDLTMDSDAQDVEGVIANVTGATQYHEFIHFIAANAMNRPQKDASNPWDGKKLVVHAAHDTSIMPFLAALGGEVFDKKWPPYASAVVLEIYRALHGGDYLFRLLYNGEVLTSRIPECSEPVIGAHDLCKLSSFFVSTEWATPSQAAALCDGTGAGAFRDTDDSVNAQLVGLTNGYPYPAIGRISGLLGIVLVIILAGWHRERLTQLLGDRLVYRNSGFS